ncbi:unnamed protein product [Bathycoccus prasinos]
MSTATPAWSQNGFWRKPGNCALRLSRVGQNDAFKTAAENDAGHKIAVIVNDVAALNIDASFAAAPVHMLHVADGFSESDCGTGERGVQYDAIAEASGTKSLRNARDKNAGFASAKCNEGLVDCSAFNGDITIPEDLRSRFDGRGREWRRSAATLLMEQIEFADLIVLNKCDLVKRHETNAIISCSSA